MRKVPEVPEDSILALGCSNHPDILHEREAAVCLKR